MVRRPGLAVVIAFLVLLVSVPSASAQQPKRGGVLRIADREAPNLDPHLNISFLTHSWANMVYSQLVRYTHGPEQKHPADFSIVPEPRGEVGVQEPDHDRLHAPQGRPVPQQAPPQRS